MPANRIILVEDHLLLRDLLSSAINSSPKNAVVACADSVAEALKACAEHEPDLMILNWNLPDGTGLEVVRGVRQNSARTKILITSSSEEEGIVRDAAQSGVHGFVSKRQPASVLMNAMTAILDGKCYYCPSSSRMLLEAMREKAPEVDKNLSLREREILRLITNGKSTKEAAQSLGITPKTVANQITLIKNKLEIRETAGLIRYAVKHGLAELS